MNKHNKETIRFANLIVFNYAEFDRIDKRFDLDINDVPDFDLHKLAALIMSEDTSYANEATGCDNPAYEKSMLPALHKFMMNSADRDNEIEFLKAWEEGITSYFMPEMGSILEEALIEYNHDRAA